MSHAPLALVPVACLVAAWIGHQSGPVAAVGFGLAVGTAAALVLDRRQRGRLRAVSRAVNAWMGKVDIVPLTVRGGRDEQELASSLNALGAAYGRRGERVLRAAPELEDLLESLPEPALLFDTDLTLVAANTPAHELFQIAGGRTTATQALGSSALAELVRQTVARPQQHHLEARVGERLLEARTTPLAERVLFVARDRTDDVRLEALRRDFVANASHELKSPVAGIRSLADALDVVIDKDPAKAHELVARIVTETDRLALLTTDLLSLSRVDERIAGDAVETIDLADVIPDVMASLLPSAERAGVGLRAHVPEGAMVRAVPEDVRLVVVNLVDNGIKYNRPEGTVTVTVEQAAAVVVITVKDSGIGIPGKDLGRIFERFQRVDEGRSRAAGGTGLGLSIVRHAVERNGGHVSVTSLLGAGTTFEVTLPAAAR